MSHYHNVNKSLCLLFMLLSFVCMRVSAEALLPVQRKTEVNADGSITFRCYAPAAKKVEVTSDCLLRKPDKSWFGGQMYTRKMKRQDDGVWTYTTKVLPPEVYQYRFIIDGNFIRDTLNADSACVLLHTESVIAVGGTPMADLYVEPAGDVPRGKIDTIAFYDIEQQLMRMILVYIPPFYPLVGEAKQDISVLYMFHGISGDEASWIESGRAFQVFDNLISHGKMKPMLVVMPDCNVLNKIAPKRRTNLLRNMFNYPALQQCHFEQAFVRLAHEVEEYYGIDDIHYRFVAGLSSGAKQAANIARDNPHMFQVVGLFSPVLGKEQLPDTAQIAPLTQAQINDKWLMTYQQHPMTYYVAIGKGDLFYTNGKNFCKRLDKKGVMYEKLVTDGGHTWKSWRVYLAEYLMWLNDNF